jgi:stress-induced-phosphoprotein 1
MSTHKDQGNEAFKQKDYQGAIKYYTEAVKENPSDHTIYGNRAAAHHNLGDY